MTPIKLFSFIIVPFLIAQDPPPSTDGATPKPGISPPAIKPMEEALKNKKEIPGLITLYQDTSNGKMHMLLKSDQLNHEYIYFVHGLDGQIDAGVFRGSYRGARIIKFKRYFNRVEFEIQNISLFFDPENPLSRAADANVSTAILASAFIIGEKKGSGEYGKQSDAEVLIDVDDVFLSEALHQITRGTAPGDKTNRFKIGKLVKNRSKYSDIKNYPENTDLIVQYVYSNPTPTHWGSDVGLTDARSVNVTLQHSFIKMPVNDYKPRFEDPRVGYFTTQVTDMTSPDDVTPYRDLVHRWHLVKKEPEKDFSEPVTPIVWWIENTTPHEFRNAIEEGVLAWNLAFREAGFKDAVQVKVQPDDADWDAGDIRYNVLRWTSSPNPPFGGYGPSFVNPRTGQILGADIMLEYVYFTNRVKYERLFDVNSTPELLPNKNSCQAGAHLHQANLFGITAINTLEGFGQLEQRRMIYEGLVKLTLHEIGHTLGLTHNFYASQLHSLKNIHDRNTTETIGLTASVMDYVGANVNPGHHGQFYSTIPGPYDKWVIEFGYAPSLDDPINEEERAKNLLGRSTQPKLGYGNDADDMRSPGKGIDPRVMINDMTNDPMGYAQERMEMVRTLYKSLRRKYEQEDQSYHALTDAFYILSREYSMAAGVISRYIGGVYMDRSMVGQEGREVPFRPVPEDQQRWAMTLLNKYIFSLDAFSVPEDLYTHLQWERRGFSGTQDPKLHEGILGIHKSLLDQLLHINVLNRITNSELYGNSYNLSRMMSELTSACFSVDAGENVNTIRQNLQTEYTERLILIVQNKGKTKYSHISVANAHANLLKIKKFISKRHGVDLATQAHREYIGYRIKKALDT